MKNASDLKKFFILTADQLARLRGRDHLLTSQAEQEQQRALLRASSALPHVGPARAYAHFREAQARHLEQARRERQTPLRLGEEDPEDLLATTPRHATTPTATPAALLAHVAADDLLTSHEKLKRERSERKVKTSPKKKHKIKLEKRQKLFESEDEPPQTTPWLRLGQARLQRQS